jgi:hypothetical protein
MRARRNRPDLLTMKVRSALQSSIGSQHDAAQALRLLIPVSCVLLLVFIYAPLLHMEVLSLCAFNVWEFVKFWSNPVIGPWSLFHLLRALTVLFGAYLVVAFLVAWENPKRPTAAEWIGFLTGLIVVGFLLALLARVGTSVAKIGASIG